MCINSGESRRLYRNLANLRCYRNAIGPDDIASIATSEGHGGARRWIGKPLRSLSSRAGQGVRTSAEVFIRATQKSAIVTASSQTEYRHKARRKQQGAARPSGATAGSRDSCLSCASSDASHFRSRPRTTSVSRHGGRRNPMGDEVDWHGGLGLSWHLCLLGIDRTNEVPTRTKRRWGCFGHRGRHPSRNEYLAAHRGA